MTAAPTTAPPLESWTSPETVTGVAVRSQMRAAITSSSLLTFEFGVFSERECHERRVLAPAGGDDDKLFSVRGSIGHRRAVDSARHRRPPQIASARGIDGVERGVAAAGEHE